MKNYLFDIFILSLAFGIAVTLSPERYKKVITATLGVLLAASLLSPLSSLFGAIESIAPPEISDGEEEGDYIKVAKSAFEKGVRSFISSEFSVSEDCVEVEAVGFDFSSLRAEKILVTLTGRAALADTKKIKSRLEGENLGLVEVKIEI